jgi:hypothetical protein
MINYSFCPLPQSFVRLLATELWPTGGQGSAGLKNLITADRSLHMVLLRSFHDIDPASRIDRITSALGWQGLRDRFAGAYLEHRRTGQFPTCIRSEVLSDVLAFERLLKPYAIEGRSRTFLLGFYLKMLKLDQSREGQSGEEIVIDDSVVDLLSLSRSKVIKVDWALISMHLIASAIGVSDLRKMLVSNASHTEILGTLSQSEKVSYAKSLLAYGASLGEMEMFQTEIV